MKMLLKRGRRNSESITNVTDVAIGSFFKEDDQESKE